MNVVGGQAVIEGVMFRNKEKLATAVRTPKGKIIIKQSKEPSLTRFPVLGWPFIRGIVALFETLIIGMKSLLWSANMSTDQEEELGTATIMFTVLFSVAVALFLFKLIPLGIAQLSQFVVGESKTIFVIIEGVVKLGIFLGYVWLIGKQKEIARTFQYHGAEHKTINCYEKKIPITLKNVLKQPTYHPRCGTSFIIFVLLLSIIVYSFLPIYNNFLITLAVRLLFLPVIASIAYEFIRLAGKYADNPYMKFLGLPGKFVQKLTTAEPNKKQVEVAIRSLKCVL